MVVSRKGNFEEASLKDAALLKGHTKVAGLSKLLGLSQEIVDFDLAQGLLAWPVPFCFDVLNLLLGPCSSRTIACRCCRPTEEGLIRDLIDGQQGRGLATIFGNNFG